MIEYFTYTKEETEQTVQHLEQEMGTPKEYQVAQLVQVIEGQAELAMLKPNGWLEVACIDCEHVETFFGSVSQFAELLLGMKWAVDSLERFTACCSACSNREPALTDEDERMDALVYAAHKGEQG